MEAVVVVINRKRSMIAAKSIEGDFVILEILDGTEVAAGDVLSHPDFRSMGHETYRNVTQKADHSVYVQNIVWTLENARKQCFLR